MAMSFDSSGGGETEPMMDINTTPLIDVLLVLLVMLIITIPIQLHAVRLDLPRPAPQSTPPQDVRIALDIDAASRVLWQGQPVDAATLVARMRAAAAMQPEPVIEVRADREASYGVFAHVMAETRRQHLDRIAVVGAEQFAPR